MCEHSPFKARSWSLIYAWKLKVETHRTLSFFNEGMPIFVPRKNEIEPSGMGSVFLKRIRGGGKSLKPLETTYTSISTVTISSITSTPTTTSAPTATTTYTTNTTTTLPLLPPLQPLFLQLSQPPPPLIPLPLHNDYHHHFH